MRELGVSSNSSYKITAFMDHLAMITVESPDHGVFDCKPLGVIWAHFPEVLILPFCHFTISAISAILPFLPFCHSAIRPFCHSTISAILSFCHSVIKPLCLFATFPLLMYEDI